MPHDYETLLRSCVDPNFKTAKPTKYNKVRAKMACTSDNASNVV